MSDSILYIAFRVIVFCMRLLPLGFWLFLARVLGWCYYYSASSKNRRADVNLRQAFPGFDGPKRKRILRSMYARFAQNVVEALYLPHMSAEYLKSRVLIRDSGAIEEAKRFGRSVIFLGVHAGSWELSNAACAQLFPAGSYAMLAQPQGRHKKLDEYLNCVRKSKGIEVIRVGALKTLMQHLSGGKALGTIADHGGRDGVAVEFFGKLAMTPVGGVRLAKKTGGRIILAFMRRLGASRHEILLEPYEFSGGDLEQDLTQINKVFEGWIRSYPEEYLWSYKRWKYSPQKNVLILSDGKVGHLKQSQACADCLRRLGFVVKVDTVDSVYKNRALAKLLTIATFFLGRGFASRMLCFCLAPSARERLSRGVYDIVISTGSSLAALNQILAYRDLARSIVVMKPGVLPLSRFDLVVAPLHDRIPARGNVVSVPGSLNIVDAETCEKDFQRLCNSVQGLSDAVSRGAFTVGLLIGGDSKDYVWSVSAAESLCRQVAAFLKSKGGQLLLTTSRRTPPAVVDVARRHFAGDRACKLFVVASEHNPEGTVGGIFYASDVIVVSGESISMVSEAAASGKPVLVFEPQRRHKHSKAERFLKTMTDGRYINLVDLEKIYDMLGQAACGFLQHEVLDTRKAVLEVLKKIL